MKLMIATPAYSGKVTIPYCIAFAQTVNYLSLMGIKVTPLIHASGSLLVSERNALLKKFYDSDCTHMLCVDADIGWKAKDLIRLIEYDEEFIGGVYPARLSDDYYFRPALKNDNKFITHENHKHLVKAEYIPAGFMLLKKSVIEKMRKKFPELYFEPKDETRKSENGYCFFDTEVWEGEFWGEDFVFCRRVREAGVDIWVDPYVEFDHDGKSGKLIDRFHLNNRLTTVSEAA